MKSCASDALLSVRSAIVKNFPPADSPCCKRKFLGFDSPPGACRVYCSFCWFELRKAFVSLTSWRNDGCGGCGGFVCFMLSPDGTSSDSSRLRREMSEEAVVLPYSHPSGAGYVVQHVLNESQKLLLRLAPGFKYDV